MKKEDQTTEVKERLYKLTLQFVRKYQPRYYRQYRGDQEDLALEFYCQFLTPKSRIKGKEESLLDKYDSTITSLEYLVKISVQRMLIDRSRADIVRYKSIDHFTDEFGDVIIKTFKLSTEDEEKSIDDLEMTDSLIDLAREKFNGLSPELRTSVIKQYDEIRSILEPRFRKFFDSFIPRTPKVEPQVPQELTFEIETGAGIVVCPCQQITPKTVCLLYEGKVLDFDRITGQGRGKGYQDLRMTAQALELVKDFDIFKSGYDRVDFVSAYA